MKNGSMTDKLRMQEQELKAPEQDFAGEKKKVKDDLQTSRYADKQADLTENKFANKQDSSSADLGLASVFSILPSAADINPIDNNRRKSRKRRNKDQD